MRNDQVFEPAADVHARYDEIFDVYRDLHKRLAPGLQATQRLSVAGRDSRR